MASPTVDGFVSGTRSGSNAITVSLSTTHPNDIIYVIAYCEGNAGAAPYITGITSSLTFVSRNNSPSTGSTKGTMEVWYALSSSILTSSSFVISYSGNFDDCSVVAFGLTGANYPSFLDANFGSIKKLSATTTTFTPTHTVTTTNSNDLIIVAYGAANSSNPTLPGGFTTLATANNGGGALFSYLIVGYQAVSSPLSSAGFTSGTYSIGGAGETILDAITADAGGITQPVIVPNLDVSHLAAETPVNGAANASFTQQVTEAVFAAAANVNTSLFVVEIVDPNTTNSITSGFVAEVIQPIASNNLTNQMVVEVVETIQINLVSVTISPSSPMSISGQNQTRQLVATAHYDDNSSQQVQPTWSSSNPQVATVSNTGLLTSIGNGSFVITATYQTHTATVSGTISFPVVDSLAITPPSVTLTAAGAVQQLTARGILTDNSTVVETANWSSSDDRYATVSVQGLVTAVATGSSVITASYQSFSATCTVTVAIPIVLDISADNDNIPVNGTCHMTALLDHVTNITNQVFWQSSDPTVATIDNTGLVTGISAGFTLITAVKSGTTSDPVRVTVIIPLYSFALVAEYPG